MNQTLGLIGAGNWRPPDRGGVRHACLAVWLAVVAMLVWPVGPGAGNALRAAKTYPDAIGYVSDFGQVVAPEIERQIADIATELNDKTGAQIAVATFQNMNGDEIDGFTSKLFEQWMPGKKGIDNGILIVNALDERQVRIEIGYGLEGVINDAKAGEIRRDLMTPLLKEGKYGEAYLVGVAAIAGIIAQSENVELETLKGKTLPRGNGGGRGGSGIGQILFVLFILLVIWLSNRRRRRGGFYGSGPWIGGMGGGGFGGWGDGGGGGGGFGGFGGGGSGGGGSSGGY
jgi:uncharacterized protein